MNINLANFIVKIVGILTIIYAIPFLRPIFDIINQSKFKFFEDDAKNLAFMKYGLVSTSTIFILLILVGTSLLIFSKTITSRLISNDLVEKNNSEVSLQVFGFSVLGVFLLLSAIPEIIQPITHYYILSKAGDARPALSVNLSSWANLIANSVQAILGILIFFGSKGLSTLWYYFQKSRPLSKENINT